MFKSVIKEFIILILLLIAIVLIFAILLYDYNPLNKTIPKKVEAYVLPEDVQIELDNTLNGEEKIVKTYQIDGIELDKYEKENEYNPGKIEPYSLYNSTIKEIKPAENSAVKNTTEGTQTENNTSEGVFFNIVGK